jgi:hypothetical protein
MIPKNVKTLFDLITALGPPARAPAPAATGRPGRGQGTVTVYVGVTPL